MSADSNNNNNNNSSNNKKSAPGGWNCSNCTFYHHVQGPRCVMCLELRGATRQQMHDFVLGKTMKQTRSVDDDDGDDDNDDDDDVKVLEDHANKNRNNINDSDASNCNNSNTPKTRTNNAYVSSKSSQNSYYTKAKNNLNNNQSNNTQTQTIRSDLASSILLSFPTGGQSGTSATTSNDKNSVNNNSNNSNNSSKSSSVHKRQSPNPYFSQQSKHAFRNNNPRQTQLKLTQLSQTPHNDQPTNHCAASPHTNLPKQQQQQKQPPPPQRPPHQQNSMKPATNQTQQQLSDVSTQNRSQLQSLNTTTTQAPSNCNQNGDWSTLFSSFRNNSTSSATNGIARATQHRQTANNQTAQTLSSPNRPATSASHSQTKQASPQTLARKNNDNNNNDENNHPNKTQQQHQQQHPFFDSTKRPHQKKYPYQVGPVPFCPNACKYWVYPDHPDYAKRQYQLEISESALFHNTLVSLPTGLGKTLIAAVVMYNFHSWFPTGKILFLAPTLPLVHQQVKACFEIMGLPESETAILTGKTKAQQRQVLWACKRIFYCTPQTVQKDFESGIVGDTHNIVCVVFDEVHKATGEYAYVKIIPHLHKTCRLVGLSTTPGTTTKSIQQVIKHLRISKLEARAEDDPTVHPYLHEKHTEIVLVPRATIQKEVERDISNLMAPILKRLSQQGGMRYYGNETITTYQIHLAKTEFAKRFKANGGNNGGFRDSGALFGVFHAAHRLVDIRNDARTSLPLVKTKLLRMMADVHTSSNRRGILRTIVQSEEFVKLVQKVRNATSSDATLSQQAQSNPKLTKLIEIIREHFARAKACERSSRVIVFSQFRDSVSEIVAALKPLQPDIRPTHFVGQGKGTTTTTKTTSTAATKNNNNDKQEWTTAGNNNNSNNNSNNNNAGDKDDVGLERLQGMNQDEQQRVILQFRNDRYNVLVCTCIGEEGLDIGEVDLIVNYDTLRSPIRMIQRTGRTGRKRDGRVVCLVAQGQEEQTWKQSEQAKKTLWRALLNPKGFALDPVIPLFPTMPQQKFQQMSIPKFQMSLVGGGESATKKRKRGNPNDGAANSAWKLSASQEQVRQEIFGTAYDISIAVTHEMASEMKSVGRVIDSDNDDNGNDDSDNDDNNIKSIHKIFLSSQLRKQLVKGQSLSQFSSSNSVEVGHKVQLLRDLLEKQERKRPYVRRGYCTVSTLFPLCSIETKSDWDKRRKMDEMFYNSGGSALSEEFGDWGSSSPTLTFGASRTVKAGNVGGPKAEAQTKNTTNNEMTTSSGITEKAVVNDVATTAINGSMVSSTALPAPSVVANNKTAMTTDEAEVIVLDSDNEVETIPATTTDDLNFGPLRNTPHNKANSPQSDGNAPKVFEDAIKEQTSTQKVTLTIKAGRSDAEDAKLDKMQQIPPLPTRAENVDDTFGNRIRTDMRDKQVRELNTAKRSSPVLQEPNDAEIVETVDPDEFAVVWSQIKLPDSNGNDLHDKPQIFVDGFRLPTPPASSSSSSSDNNSDNDSTPKQRPIATKRQPKTAGGEPRIDAEREPKDVPPKPQDNIAGVVLQLPTQDSSSEDEVSEDDQSSTVDDDKDEPPVATISTKPIEVCIESSEDENDLPLISLKVDAEKVNLNDNAAKLQTFCKEYNGVGLTPYPESATIGQGSKADVARQSQADAKNNGDDKCSGRIQRIDKENKDQNDIQKHSQKEKDKNVRQETTVIDVQSTPEILVVRRNRKRNNVVLLDDESPSLPKNTNSNTANDNAIDNDDDYMSISSEICLVDTPPRAKITTNKTMKNKYPTPENLQMDLLESLSPMKISAIHTNDDNYNNNRKRKKIFPSEEFDGDDDEEGEKVLAQSARKDNQKLPATPKEKEQKIMPDDLVDTPTTPKKQPDESSLRNYNQATNVASILSLCDTPPSDCKRPAKRRSNDSSGLTDTPASTTSASGMVRSLSLDPDDIVCAVCMSGEYDEDSNPIFLCDGTCKLGFHKQCYPPCLLVRIELDEAWRCDPCDARYKAGARVGSLLGADGEICCTYCQQTDGALVKKKLVPFSWYHPYCERWKVPKDGKYYDKNIICQACQKPNATKCFRCDNAMHPHCAIFNSQKAPWTLLCATTTTAAAAATSFARRNHSSSNLEYRMYCSTHEKEAGMFLSKQSTRKDSNNNKNINYGIDNPNTMIRSITQNTKAKSTASKKSLRKLKRLGIPDPDERYHDEATSKLLNDDDDFDNSNDNNQKAAKRQRLKERLSKLSIFVDEEAAIQSDDDADDYDEEEEIRRTEAEELSQNSFINDAVNLTQYNDDEIGRADPDANHSGFGGHQALDAQREREEQFATPLLNRRMRNHDDTSPNNNSYINDRSTHSSASDQGLGNMHFIRSVLEHHRKGGDCEQIENLYQQLEQEHTQSSQNDWDMIQHSSSSRVESSFS